MEDDRGKEGIGNFIHRTGNFPLLGCCASLHGVEKPIPSFSHFLSSFWLPFFSFSFFFRMKAAREEGTEWTKKEEEETMLVRSMALIL